jgi:ferric-dicitrate binding protein FerR (iron transport regulator)
MFIPYLENERLGDCRITATFNDEPIEEITQIIAETLGLEASRTDSGYVFNGNACY